MRIKTSNGVIINVDKPKIALLLKVLSLGQTVVLWSLSTETVQGLLH